MTYIIKGKRLGFLADAEYDANPILIRGEIFQYNFSESLSDENQTKYFLGGYGELGYFLFGNTSDGLQLIGRFETARVFETYNLFTGPAQLNSYILGTNWYQNNIFRLQVNVIYESANRKSLLDGRYSGKDNELLLLTMLQLKF
jgi:phosphate-selective porin